MRHSCSASRIDGHIDYNEHHRVKGMRFIQDHTGIDGKKARTLLRGYGDWLIEDSVFAGGAFGPNPMQRGNGGLGKGFFELFRGRGNGDPLTSEGGMMFPLTHDRAAAATNAAAAARASGKDRREIVRAAFEASGVNYRDTDIEDTIWNRDMTLAQRSKAVVRRCRFDRSPDGVPVSLEYAAGLDLTFEDCKADPTTKTNPEWVYPEYGERLQGSQNKDWVLPGDIVRPSPVIRTDRFMVGEKAYVTPVRAVA